MANRTNAFQNVRVIAHVVNVNATENSSPSATLEIWLEDVESHERRKIGKTMVVAKGDTVILDSVFIVET